MGLPRVDEHAVEVDADGEAVWGALLAVVEGSFGGPVAGAYARVVGCEPPSGFAVVTSERPSLLGLAGRHRFSTYELVFRLDEAGPGRTRLRAETRAAFPGLGGRAYRAAVIGSGGHAVLVRRLLAGVRRRAESR